LDEPVPINKNETLWDEGNGQSAFKLVDVEVEQQTTKL
jgi:hypothetical protein